MINLSKKVLSCLAAIGCFSNLALAGDLQTLTIKSLNRNQVINVEGVIEAVKTSTIAPQVSGSLTLLSVKVGDQVKAGQVLARIDPRLATQQNISNQAQVAAAQAQLSAAKQEYERKRRLHEKQYISQAALDRAESDYKTAEAQTKAQLAQTSMSAVQTGLHTITAPFNGIVAEIMTEQGDMAMPGKPILSIYDPKEMRAVVNIPLSQIANIQADAKAHVLIPAATGAERQQLSSHMTVLPTADAIGNVTKIRLALSSNIASIRPGMFTRATLPAAVNETNQLAQIYIPISAVVKRSELTAAYIIDSQGNPQLRQIRLGRRQGDMIEVFAGLQTGEKVAINPMAAANFKAK